MLLQLMVYAKIIYLLMVVISGALCTVEDYVIMSQCAHNKAIYLAAEGTVSVTDISQTQNITIVGRPDFVNNNFKIALYAKETQRYLCFNDHWKLVGMKELQDTCYFNEAIVHGYFVFRSVVDLHRRIGFTQRGRAVGPKKTVNDACYMFTKIPTDQFFHQHTHFSTPKTKTTTTTTTTTKIPKTTYTRAPYTLNTGKISGSGTGGGNGSGNGSGSGRGSIRTKPNKRFKNHQRQNDTVSHYHSGSGSGSGGGSGNGDGYKKLKRQRNGNKTRRQKQEIQQQQLSGHNYNLSNPKNSTYLNSSRKNIILSQNSLYNNNNNYTNKKQNNNNSINNNNNNKHPPQSHQVRHHHNDPNKVARRQQHDQKLKTKQRQRLRPPTTSTTYSSSSSASPATSINSIKSSHSGLSTRQSEIKPTSVATTIATTASANSNNTQSSIIVLSKRKSRRRKSDKLQKKLDYSKEQHDKGYATVTYTSSVEPAYEEDDEFTSSSTDYTWMTNDIMLSSAKPTSASLPSWETWYPSLSTSLADKNNAGYPSTYADTASASTPTDFYGDISHYSTTLESSSTTDLDKNTLTLQTSVPLPSTSMLTTTLTENGIDATILSPSVTTDLGTITTTTTTNTSTYTQTDFWSTSINNDNNNDLLHTDIGEDTDMQVTKDLHSNYATPQLEDIQTTYGLNTEGFSEDINTSTSPQSNSKGETKPITGATTVNLNDMDNEAIEIERTTTLDQEDDNTSPDPKTTEAKTDTSTTATDLHNCAYSTAAAYNDRESTMTTTDCIYATKTTEYNIANNHSFRPQENEKNLTTTTTTAFAVTATTMTTTKLNTSLPKISQSTQTSQTPLPRLITSTLQQQLQTQIVGNDLEHKVATEVATTARTLSLNKSSSAFTPITTRRTLRKSTQRLLATPFHQLTYVRNEAGDIDIDSIDNISIYPEILDNENVDEPQIKTSTSRLTMISGYLPTSATVTLPESIRIAKIKINRERKRMLRLRNISNYT